MYGVSVGICPLLPKYQLLTIAYPFNQSEKSLFSTRESFNECGQIISAAQAEILHTRSLYISSSARISG
jgi:hypothetical protein